jgi:hypothetical protein
VTPGPAAPMHRSYPGQRPYGSEDQSRFYGRERESAQVAELWSTRRLTILYGKAGVGKTSLVQAGVISLLPGRADVLPVRRILNGSYSPADALMGGHRYASTFLPSVAAADISGSLSRMSLRSFLRQRQRRLGDTPALLAVDQVEQLYRGGSRGQRDRELILAELAEALGDDQGVHAILLVREDRIGDVLAEQWPAAPATFRLSGLSRQGAIRAVREPLGGTGRSYAPGAAEYLVDRLLATAVPENSARKAAARARTLLPVLLQAVCSALWEALPADLVAIGSTDIMRLIDVDEVLAGFISSAVSATARFYDLRPVWLCSWRAAGQRPAGARRPTCRQQRHAVRVALVRVGCRPPDRPSVSGRAIGHERVRAGRS